MKFADTKLKKTIIFITGAILLTIVVVILLISPISKYLIQKYDEKYLGRQIKLSWIYVNPFTGFIHISNLRVYESDSLPYLTRKDSIFFSAKGVSIDFSILKLLRKTIEISKLVLDNPKGEIIEENKDFNFNDLIKRFTPAKNDTIPSAYHFNILNIKVKNGEFYYYDKVTPINYSIKEVNFESRGILWNVDTLGADFSFTSGVGEGSAKGNFTINFKNFDYRFTAIINKFDLKFIEPYIKEIINYGKFTASMDADIKATGNFKDEENIDAKGQVKINDFHFGKNSNDDYLSCDKMVLNIIDLSPKNHKYIIDSLTITHPVFKYEIYDHLDNLQMMFGVKGANIYEAEADSTRFNLVLKVVKYVKVLSKNFFSSDYMINNLAVYRANLIFNDYSLIEKFSIEANPFNLFADSVYKNHNIVKVYLKSGIKPYGNISLSLSLNPKDEEDFDMQYRLESLPASLFNPYLITYTSFPLDRGTAELNGNWRVRKGQIQSENHLIVIDPRVAIRRRNAATMWAPSNLIMFFIREKGNVIDYEIPITGNIKSPKFHMKEVFLDMVKNIFEKPYTTPYSIQVKNVEKEIEKSLSLEWNMRQNSLTSSQGRFIESMADFLAENPNSSITVFPEQYADKEKEYILFFEAKKKYFILSRGNNSSILSEKDSLTVDKMSVKDTLFLHFLNKRFNNSMMFTIQEKCEYFTGHDIVNVRYGQLIKERKDAFMLYFKEKNVEKRVKFNNDESIIPYNGFSNYRIVYKGDLPKELIKAYVKMDQFNDETPRKKFENLRDKIKKIIK